MRTRRRKLEPITTLIVDDSEADRYMLKRLIRKTSVECRFVEVAHGRQALDFLRHNGSRQPGSAAAPVLIFLDLNMPVMGGLEFLHELGKRRQHGLAPLMVVVFTSSDHPDDIARATSYPCVRSYVNKYPTADELNEVFIRFRSWLENSTPSGQVKGPLPPTSP